MRPLLCLLALLLPAAAQAEVYRCTQEGHTVYTDRPCAADAEPAQLPALNRSAAGPSADLAGEHDARIARDKQKRDAADARFVKEQAEKQARAQRIRAAILDHRPEVGMSASELDSALGAPDQRSGDNGRETWTYLEDGHRLSVKLRDGRVTAISKKEDRKKK